MINMKSFAKWLSEDSSAEIPIQDKDTQKPSPAHSTTFASPIRKQFNPNPSSANAVLYQQWLNNRQKQVQSGTIAAELTFFNNYNEIAELIKAIKSTCRRHNRIVAMLNKKTPNQEALDATAVYSKTAIDPARLSLNKNPNANIYKLEKQLIGTKKQVLANEFALHNIMKRQGIDMHKHLRQAAGLTRENIDQTSDFEYIHQPEMKPQGTGAVELTLDGPKHFRDIGHLAAEIQNVNTQSNQISEEINNLYIQTGGLPKPYAPDPENVLD